MEFGVMEKFGASIVSGQKEESGHGRELSTAKLSIIIPVRENGSISVIERLRWRERYIRDGIEILLVDDGSQEEYAAPIRLAAGEMGARYIGLQTKDEPFSLSRARNAGIMAATAPFVYFEDIDFLGRSDFYQRLRQLASCIDKIPFNFLSIPTLFLTKAASKELMDSRDFDATFDDFISRLPFVNPDEPNELIDSFAPVGSNLILKRSTCFHVGLFDEYFNSWGGEDREFVFRLLSHDNRNLFPPQFSHTKKWKIHRTNVFEGWRSLYRLHGDYVRNLGLYAIHLHHPDNSWKDPFSRKANFQYCDDKIAGLFRGQIKTVPVRMPGDVEHTVFVGRNPTFFNDQVMELLGSVSVVDMDYSIDPDEFARRVLHEQPSKVMFQNVYSNEWMQKVWNALRGKNVTCVCVERGAFPNSIYFDFDGFCADSSSYDAERWQSAEPVHARQYVAELRASALALEPQGNASADEIRSRLPKDKKNVLVILQSLTDATTKFFTGPLGTYDDFLRIIQDLIRCDEYNILVKNHPLNRKMPIQSGINVSDGDIYDLIDISDICITLNSGAGLLALGFGRPVITMGQCFYAQLGLAAHASNLDELTELIDRPVEFDTSAVNRFFGYLLNEFYSFADWRYGVRQQSDSTNMSLMKNVRYKHIRIGELRSEVVKPSLTQYSLIMDPYALDMFLKKKPAGGFPTSAKPVPPVRTAQQRRAAKSAKLRHDPHAFFRDAKHPMLRPLRYFFSKLN